MMRKKCRNDGDKSEGDTESRGDDDAFSDEYRDMESEVEEDSLAELYQGN